MLLGRGPTIQIYIAGNGIPAVGESYDCAKAAISLEHSNLFPWHEDCVQNHQTPFPSQSYRVESGYEYIIRYCTRSNYSNILITRLNAMLGHSNVQSYQCSYRFISAKLPCAGNYVKPIKKTLCSTRFTVIFEDPASMNDSEAVADAWTRCQ